MQFNLSPKIRFTLYIVLGIGSIVEAYLLTKGIIGTPEDVAWKAFSAFVAILAALNVSKS